MTTTDQRPEPKQPAGSPSSSHRRGAGPAGQAAARCISRLQSRYRKDNAAAVAELARLRRGAGRTAHTVQEHWGLGGLEDLADVLAKGHPGVRREHAEEAVYLAVTLWALHQQSARDSDMHVPGQTLGRAVRTLMRKSQAENQADAEQNEPLRTRLVRVGTANSIDSVALRLREIVLLLRGAGVPLDYGRLADQLYRWQSPPERADVRREWGREFHLAAWSGKNAPQDAESIGQDDGSNQEYDESGE
ncbi:type I-E CRISPR-associated protein Cse2/CasB [Streptomyces avermitilis]|uniref:type I-E CRISPR-associated protein Cse2/CasB n=1 Tax=Streptomyces avermitilis TaxID=33903 RepID=UPI0033ADCBB6